MYFPLLRNLAEGDIKGKRILLRLDLNVPIKNEAVGDDFRVLQVYPTIKFLLERGGKIIAISHHSDKKQTLRPLTEHLSKLSRAQFVPDVLDKKAIARAQEKHQIVLCENLRFHGEEEENSVAFAKQVAGMGDLYINDAFSASHRKHASIVALPRLLPSRAGFLFAEEIINLKKAFKPPHPFLFILGGAKASTKLSLIQKFLATADFVFIGGALANNFFKEKGYKVGRSLVDDSPVAIGQFLLEKKLLLPEDIVIERDGENRVAFSREVGEEDKILDAGPASLKILEALIQKSRFILWNGPIGEFEKEEFKKGSVTLMKMIAASNAESVVGGGDTVALIRKEGFQNKFGFVSTGGGAMLQFLAEETLPGIEALKG